MKYVIVTAPDGYRDTVEAILQGEENLKDVWWEDPSTSADTFTVRFVSGFGEDRKLLDSLQHALAGTDRASIHILNIDATYPNPEPLFVTPQLSREELYRVADDGARSDSLFLLLVGLSTIVACIGLLQDNIAVVIGAMVIAPLLGPNLSFALGAALGEVGIARRAALAFLKGAGLSLCVALGVGLLWPDFVMNAELEARTFAGLDSMFLALASGTAAVLSMTSGVYAVLVGVMVAVALVPPLSTAGILLGQGDVAGGVGAILLLLVNVAAINVAAHATLLFSEVAPRTQTAATLAKNRNVRFGLLWLLALGAFAVLAVYWEG